MYEVFLGSDRARARTRARARYRNAFGVRKAILVRQNSFYTFSFFNTACKGAVMSILLLSTACWTILTLDITVE